MAEKIKDLTKEKDTPPAQSPEEKTSQDDTSTVSEDLQNSEEKEREENLKEENLDDMVNQLLADGTPSDKYFTVKKSTYDRISDKAELYDKFSPLLAKIEKKPEVLDELLEEKDTGEDLTVRLEKRLQRLEEEQNAKKRTEMKEVLSRALQIWPNFQTKWNQMRPQVEYLEHQGLSYADAVQRAYFAIDPEAIRIGERLIKYQIAVQEENKRGKFSSSSGVAKVVTEDKETVPLSDADREFMGKTQRIGNVELSPELYKKHSAWIERFKDL